MGRGGKLPGQFRECGRGGKRVVGRAAAVAVPAGEEKPLVAAVENLWNVQRTAEKGAKARQVVAGLRSLHSCQRIGLCVERTGVIRNVQHAVRLIDVEMARQR